MAITPNEDTTTIDDLSDHLLLTLSTEGVYDVLFKLDNVANGDEFRFWYAQKVLSADASPAATDIADEFYVKHAQRRTRVVKWVITVDGEAKIYGRKIAGTNRSISVNAKRASSGS